ncbi:MAG: hypothetical protein HYW85_03795 [Deltaproteobacteria bacterium]|nr:hypothetical protein [Deltaproteobacteria bacterium]
MKIILPQEFFISEIIFNKNYLTSQKVKLRRQRRIYYVYIPEKNVFRGENQLSLKFQKPLDIESSVDLRFSNYITKKSDAIAIFSPTGQIFNNKKHGLFFSFVLLFFISVFLMLVFKFYLMVSLEAILKHAIFICIYNNIILGGLFYFSILFGYRTAISEYLYFNLHSIGALLCLSPIAIKWVGAAICRKA